MKLSSNGLAFLKREEGERLTGYLDNRGISVIGVGHTGLVDGKPISCKMVITENKSTELLLADLTRIERTINSWVKVKLTQNQYDALCSFVFNIGASAFIKSSVLQCLNKGNYTGAATSILIWERSGDNNEMLAPRRRREYELFIL